MNLSRNDAFSLVLATLLCVGRVTAQEPQIEISSPDPRLSGNVRAHLTLPALDCGSDPAQLARGLRSWRPALENSVQRASQALGYYEARAEIAIEAQDDCWTLSLSVLPGRPTLIETVFVSIAEDEQLFEPSLGALPIREGEQLNHADYEAAKAALSSAALSLGFLDARFSRTTLSVDPARATAQVQLALDPGTRYRFGELIVDTSGTLSEEFVARFRNFEEGDFYSPETLLELRRRLNDSQYFQNVALSPQLDAVQGRQGQSAIPIRATLTPRPRRVYEYGAGVSTDTGPRVSAYYEDRFRNPRGHRLNATSTLSTVQRSLDVDTLIPLANPTAESLRLSAGFLEENTATFDSLSYRSSATYTFVNRSNWQQSFFANFRHDEFILNGERETSDLLIPGLSIAKTQADDALVPERGWRLGAQLRGAEKTLLASESFLQLNLNGKLIAPLGRGRLIGRFELGTTYVTDIGELPASIQYFTGGDQSVRGYDYKSIGAAGNNDLVVGGKSLFVGSLEFDFEIAPRWRLAVFADIGDAFDEPTSLSLNRSVGAGIRWISPIGPVRLDLARPLDSEESVRFHLTMGPDL